MKAKATYSSYDAVHNGQQACPVQFDEAWFRTAIEASGYPELFGFRPEALTRFENGAIPYDGNIVPVKITARWEHPKLGRLSCRIWFESYEGRSGWYIRYYAEFTLRTGFHAATTFRRAPEKEQAVFIRSFITNPVTKAATPVAKLPRLEIRARRAGDELRRLTDC